MAEFSSKRSDEIYRKALEDFSTSLKKMGDLYSKVEQRMSAYYALVDEERSKKLPDWMSQLTPPYAMHEVETSLAALTEDKLRFRVKPRPMVVAPEELEQHREGAMAHQILMDWQCEQTDFSELQRPFCMQCQVAGWSVAKNFWLERRERRRRARVSQQQVQDSSGMPVIDPFTNQPMTKPKISESEKEEVVYDGPFTEVVDVRDFGWNEAAVSLEKARYVWHRVRLPREMVLQGYEDGIYGPDVGGVSKKECETALPVTSSFSDDVGKREQIVHAVNVQKDLVELVEVWDKIEKITTTFVNRNVRLSVKRFPFYFTGPPFVVCATQPDLFQIPGISQVERIRELQSMLWDIGNRRLDNLSLVNMAIFLIRRDMDDPDALKLYPGAKWPVDDPSQVQMWTPNVIPAQVSLGAEQYLKGDIQNLGGGFPFATGSESSTIDQKTATGASIITSIAQRSVNMQRAQVMKAWGRCGQQRMLLNQQFMRKETVVPVVGLEGEDDWVEVYPELLDGDYLVDMEPMADSMIKQEEQAQAQALMTLAMQAVPMSAQLSQVGASKGMNFDAFVEDLLEAFGHEDTGRYFSQKPVAITPQAGGVQQPGSPPAPGGVPAGTTSPLAHSPTSPSSNMTLSPESLMQRALASSGGANNGQR